MTSLVSRAAHHREVMWINGSPSGTAMASAMREESAYLRRRYGQEMAAALGARCPEARAAHREMARRYALRLECCTPADLMRGIPIETLAIGTKQKPERPVRTRTAAASELAD